jgi:hypothetical protein
MGQIQARREVESGAKIGEVHDPNKKCQLEALTCRDETRKGTKWFLNFIKSNT